MPGFRGIQKRTDCKMAKSKLVKMNENIAHGVCACFKSISDSVTGAYNKIENKFIEQYLTKDGESVEEAKRRYSKRKSWIR